MGYSLDSDDDEIQAKRCVESIKLKVWYALVREEYPARALEAAHKRLITRREWEHELSAQFRSEEKARYMVRRLAEDGRLPEKW